jgi:hypothetical protein
MAREPQGPTMLRVSGCGECPFGVSSVCGAKARDEGGTIIGYRYDMVGAPDWCPIRAAPIIVRLEEDA